MSSTEEPLGSELQKPHTEHRRHAGMATILDIAEDGLGKVLDKVQEYRAPLAAASVFLGRVLCSSAREGGGRWGGGIVHVDVWKSCAVRWCGWRDGSGGLGVGAVRGVESGVVHFGDGRGVLVDGVGHRRGGVAAAGPGHGRAV